MEEMTGLPSSLARSTARQIMSEARPEPPGLLMRRTIALTLSSLRAVSIALTIVFEPMAARLPKRSYWLLPLTIGPVQ